MEDKQITSSKLEDAAMEAAKKGTPFSTKIHAYKEMFERGANWAYDNLLLDFGFIDWMWDNRWFNKVDGKWHYTFEQGTYMSQKTYQKNYVKTTEELYQLYLESKK